MTYLRVKKMGRPNRLDLVRRARKLGIEPGHLSQVLRGKRESGNLLARFQYLVAEELEQLLTKNQNENH